MTAPGTPFESPRACPFVALEQDRDRRSDTPDYRHRCFAEPTPAPRSIAHQEAYCLSPNFAACPVFQDWAVRAAARPVEGSGSSAADAAALAGGTALAGGVAAAAGSGEIDVDRDLAEVAAEAPEAGSAAAADESAIEELPEDASVTAAGAEIAAAAAATSGISPGVASPPTFATTDWQSEAHESEQLSAFDAAAAHDSESLYDPYAAHDPYVAHDPAPAPAPDIAQDPRSSYGQPDAGYPEPQDRSAAFVPPPSRPEPPPSSTPPQDVPAAVAAPAFLAGRSARPPAPSDDTGLPPPNVSRDDIVPSWDIDGRYGAEVHREQDGGGGGRLDGILTAIAVIAILALGVAAVLFLPGLLNKPAAPRTPGPSFVIPSGAASVAPSVPASAPASVTATTAPSVEPTTQSSQGPAASPRSYKIKPGDSLARIANRFGVSVQDILDANPNITNPNNIFVGQIIVIPQPASP